MDERDLAEDLRKLLDLAEGTKQSVRLSERRIATYRVIEFGLLALSVTLEIIAINSWRASVFTLPFLVFGLAVLFLAVFIETRIVRQLVTERKADSRALARAVSVLRETESSIRHQLSPLELAEFRIRLATYDIDESRS
jgi:hypothetical protein